MPKIIILDALIGAGKSTLLRILTEKFNSNKVIYVIPEPVDEWKASGHLDAFYGNMKEKSFEFQIIAFTTRTLGVNKLVEENSSADIIILERSIFSDRYMFTEILHDQGLMCDRLYNEYTKWWDNWSQLVNYKPDLFVYLRPSIEVCMARVQKRNRASEVKSLTVDYQKSLQDKQDQFYSNDYVTYKYKGANTNTPVLRLCVDGEFETDESLQNQIYGDIITALGF